MCFLKSCLESYIKCMLYMTHMPNVRLHRYMRPPNVRPGPGLITPYINLSRNVITLVHHMLILDLRVTHRLHPRGLELSMFAMRICHAGHQNIIYVRDAGQGAPWAGRALGKTAACCALVRFKHEDQRELTMARIYSVLRCCRARRALGRSCTRRRPRAARL
jgi:hypothetical protein